MKRGICGGVGIGGGRCVGEGKSAEGGAFVREAAGEHGGSPIGELLIEFACGASAAGNGMFFVEVGPGRMAAPGDNALSGVSEF